MKTFFLYLITAIAEIVGCYLPCFGWARRGSVASVAYGGELGCICMVVDSA